LRPSAKTVERTDSLTSHRIVCARVTSIRSRAQR
jgi:hypothetical protein